MNNLYLSPEAQDDLSEIKAYIAEDLENPQAALSTVTKITKTIRMLQEHALIGVPLSAIADVNSDYRYLISGSYMIFYRVTGKDVTGNKSSPRLTWVTPWAASSTTTAIW